MIKIFTIAKWEFVQKVKTRAFVVSLIITPIILISFTIGGTLLSGKEPTEIKPIGILDSSAIYFSGMRDKLESFILKNNQPQYLVINFFNRNLSFNNLIEQVDDKVLNKRIEGCIVIYNGGTDTVRAEFRSALSVNFNDIGKFQKAFNEVRTYLLLSKYGISRQDIKNISNEITIPTIKISKKGQPEKADFLLTFFSSIIFIMMLMTVVMASGGMLVRSLVEEKSNRLIDIIISSCTPGELLSGKIIGLSAVGLLQILIWIIIGIIISGWTVIPPQAFENFSLILIYFILGFFFYTSIFVGVGSIVTTEQEAQLITGYLTLILVFPIILALPAIENPDTILVKILSYFPLTLPTVMMLRLNLSPIPLTEILSTIILMVVSIIVTIIIASKFFRIGILTNGKMPSLRELISWIKEKS